jgi:hypothetical protein
MIIRIRGEGQYQLADAAEDGLNELDDEVVARMDADDEAGFHRALEQLLGFVRSAGDRLDDHELEVSDHVLPPPDTTLSEARAAFAEDGVIPG